MAALPGAGQFITQGAWNGNIYAVRPKRGYGALIRILAGRKWAFGGCLGVTALRRKQTEMIEEKQ